MVAIPGATFTMGDNGAPEEDERPEHRVALLGFCLDRTEVTVGAYRDCVKNGRCAAPTDRHAIGFENPRECTWTLERDELPMSCVTFTEAQAYCADRGARLPTEEEWELAARGVDRRPFPWGSREPVGRACWNRRQDGPCRVAESRGDVSPYGVLDLGGSMQELTSTPLCRYDGSAPCAPWMPVAVRGGAWSSAEPDLLRATRRIAESRGTRATYLGFRCAKGQPPAAHVWEPDVTAMCRCFQEAYGQPSCAVEAAEIAIVHADHDCVRSHASDCGRMVACSRGEPDAAPVCLPGFRNVGAAGFCAPACSRDEDCPPGGECYQDEGACLSSE